MWSTVKEQRLCSGRERRGNRNSRSHFRTRATGFSQPWQTAPNRPVHTRRVLQCGHSTSLFSVPPQLAQCLTCRVLRLFRPTRSPQSGHFPGVLWGECLSIWEWWRGDSFGASAFIDDKCGGTKYFYLAKLRGLVVSEFESPGGDQRAIESALFSGLLPGMPTAARSRASGVQSDSR